MGEHELKMEQIKEFGKYLFMEERSQGTIEKYMRDTENFYRWLNHRTVTKERAAEWKAYLMEGGYAPITVNSMLSALNSLFKYLGWNECRVKFLRIQRQIFRNPERELNRTEYQRLLTSAREQGRERLFLLMETICATGIRVSEVKYITMETIRKGRAEIALKGKIRVILLPKKLCSKLMKYAKKEKISEGPIFRTKRGNVLCRRQIWAELKGLCQCAGIERTKVFPHNLRHLFARCFYNVCKDIVRLADVLGHSSIETTRIYLAVAGREHLRILNQLNLIS